MNKLIIQRSTWIELLNKYDLYQGPFKNRKVILMSLIWAFRNTDRGMTISNSTLGEDYLDCSEDKTKKLLKELFDAGLVTKKRNYNNPSSYYPSKLMKDSGKPFSNIEKDSGKPRERSPESTKPSSKEEGTKGKLKNETSFYDDVSFCEKTYQKYLKGYGPDYAMKMAKLSKNKEYNL